jgi:hypothetical protein
MAETELVQEQAPETGPIGRADLLVAIAAPADSEVLAVASERVAEASRLLASPCNIVFALPGETRSSVPKVLDPIGASSDSMRSLQYVNYVLPGSDPAAMPWLAESDLYRAVFSLAGELYARACTILGTGPGFNRSSMPTEKLVMLLGPGLEGNFDLVMPIYTPQAYEDLVNKSILYPLTRALYGNRVRHPLANEFQVSSRLIPPLSSNAGKDSGRQQARLLWPATTAAARNLRMCQVHIGKRPVQTHEGIELSDALAQLVGPLFVDMEDNATLWQRVRGSHDVTTFGTAEPPLQPTEDVDVRPMLEAFQLGMRNLREIWSLVLPPITLLELRKLAHASAEEFRLPDALWARIIYDFALASRLRNIRRAHLFGALTPLYLGWAASYAMEINRLGFAASEERLETLARTYEAEKPYLLSRWRWPDRFHP